ERECCEANTVDSANRFWQSVLAEQPFECKQNGDLFGRSQRFAGEHVTTVLIGDRERITVVAVAHEEFAFEVSGPQRVRCCSIRCGLAWMLEASPSSSRITQPGALQDLARSAA